MRFITPSFNSTQFGALDLQPFGMTGRLAAIFEGPHNRGNPGYDVSSLDLEGWALTTAAESDLPRRPEGGRRQPP